MLVYVCVCVQVMKEMRVKGELMDHKEVTAAIGVKIVAPGLETAVAGTSMFVVSVLVCIYVCGFGAVLPGVTGNCRAMICRAIYWKL